MTSSLPAINGVDPITAVRTNLARRFCRVVAVIDDEIEAPNDPHRFTEPFSALRKRFDESSIICHLHHYQETLLPPEDEESVPRVNRALEIAAAADLVVIDWHLGMKDDPSHALSVIKKLQEREGIRFVLINTRIEPREPARIIQEQLQAVKEDTPQGTSDDLIRLRIGDNFFLSVRQKAGTAHDADALLQEAHEWLSTSFPDHLHWAGLEIAVRVREMLPKVVAAMPKGTNAALVHQLLFQRNSEIAEQITDVFLDELKLHFRIDPLKNVSDDVLFDTLRKKMQHLVGDASARESLHDSSNPDWRKETDAAENKQRAHALLKKEKATKSKLAALSDADRDAVQNELNQLAISSHEGSLIEFRKKLSTLPKLWEEADLSKLRLLRQQMKHFPTLKKISNPAIIAQYLKKAFSADDDGAFSSWASLKESAQLPFVEPTTLFPGCVLQRMMPAAGEHEWLLCATPACDCYWKNTKGYLFVVGQSQPASEPSSLSITQMWFKNVNIGWNSKTLVVKKPTVDGPNIIPGYKVVGAVRPPFASRLIHRVWSYQSRVGVDTSEYYRDIRAE